MGRIAKNKRKAGMKEPVRRDTSDVTRRRAKRSTAPPPPLRNPIDVPGPHSSGSRRKPAGARRRRGGLSAESVDVLYRLLLAAAFFAIAAFVSTAFFTVKTIEVTGTKVCLPQQVVDASGVKLRDKLLFVNRFEVAGRIFEALSYVDSIRVRQRFPDTLVLEVTECVPAAVLVSGGTSYVIDGQCKLLEYKPYEGPSELLEVRGMQVKKNTPGKTVELEDALRLTTLKDLIADLALEADPEFLKKIGPVQAQRLYDLEFVYEERIVVSVGDTANLPRKLELLREVLSRLGETERGWLNVEDDGTARFLEDAEAVSNSGLPVA